MQTPQSSPTSPGLPEESSQTLRWALRFMRSRRSPPACFAPPTPRAQSSSCTFCSPLSSPTTRCGPVAPYIPSIPAAAALILTGGPTLVQALADVWPVHDARQSSDFRRVNASASSPSPHQFGCRLLLVWCGCEAPARTTTLNTCVCPTQAKAQRVPSLGETLRSQAELSHQLPSSLGGVHVCRWRWRC
jgi:hypothetical protein